MPDIRQTRGPALVAGALAIAMLSACSASQRPSIAHANNATPAHARSAAPTGPASSAAKFQAYLASERAYAGCMRGLGLDVTDPDANGVQRANYKAILRNGGKLSAEQNSGLRACLTKLLPDPRPQTYPLKSETEFRYDQKMAKCFRAHGIPGYPDPIRQTDPSLPAVKHYESTLKQQPTASNTFQTALNTCSVLITGHEGQG